jgi:prepilin-type processing-associated H-X9-DG protein/prepilin-type N-terminal cleavage/methylation domain-containing protein
MFGQGDTSFTLVELMVVIAVIALVATLAFPAYQSVMASSRSTQCRANLREIFTAFQGYVQDNNGQYPPATANPNNVNSYWFLAIGTYQSEGRRFDPTKVGTNGPWPQKTPFACPSCTNHGWGRAGIDVGVNGYQLGAGLNTSVLRAAHVSTPAATMLVADAQNPDGSGAWGIGYRIGSNKKFEKNAIAMRHKGRANVLYFDGHVGQITAEQLNDPKFVEQLGGPEF